MIKNALAAGLFAASALASGPALAQDAASVEDGEKIFKRCAACHQVGADAKNRVGPILTGLIGRDIASVEEFDYSDGMLAYAEEHGTWDEELLFTYLEDPRGIVKGTKMAFAGLRKEEDRRAVIEYIKSESGEPAS